MKKEDLLFTWDNFIHPEGKIIIDLGNSEIGKRYKAYFNQRSVKRLFIPNKKYNCAIIDLQQFQTFEDYVKTVKGKNSTDYFSRRANKLGYEWKIIDANEYIDEIFQINISATNRQGRQMDESYQHKVEKWPNNEQNIWVGVFNKEEKLVSYIWLVISNELFLMNRILGHGDFLKDNIMYLNTLGAINWIFNHTTKTSKSYLMYDTFGRHKNGLVLFKKRIGFKPYTVDFV